jgi:hypothetical protein
LVEVGCLQNDGAVLHAGGKNLKLDIGRAESAEVLGAGIGHKGVSLSVATGQSTIGLGKFKIVGHAKNRWGGVANHVLP